MEEEELQSTTTLLYPIAADSDEEAELPTETEGTTYLFPASEFEPDSDASTSNNSPNGEIVRNCIVQDIISVLLRRVIPHTPEQPKDYPFSIKPSRLLTRDEIIKQAMEQAYHSRSRHEPLNTQPLLQNSWNKKPKIPPIKLTNDPDIRELIQKGKSKGYSDAALLKTRRDNQTRRLLIPNKEEAETVDVWRLEEQYRTSINKLKGYTQ